jgi:TPR repeat protein
MRYLYIILLFAFSDFAHADFRRALDAMQLADGKNMIYEVEDAVKTKNNDGLALFLSSLQYDSKKNFLTYPQKPTTYSFVYPELVTSEQLPDFMKQLETAVNLADINVKFNFFRLQHYIANGKNYKKISDAELERFANLGANNAVSQRAMSKDKLSEAINDLEWLEKSAKLGSAYDTARLVDIYLGTLPDPYEPENPEKKPLPALIPDAEKGIYWLKRAAVITHNAGYVCKLADEYYEGKNIKQDKKQAYLWYVEAYSQTSFYKCSENGLLKMAIVGDLDKYNKELATQLKVNKTQGGYLEKAKNNIEQPVDLVLIQKEYAAIKRSIYEWSGNGLKLELFKDGTVKYGSTEGGYEWKVQPSKISDFLKEIKNAGFFELSNHISDSVPCDMGESWIDVTIRVSDRNKIKNIHYRSIRNLLLGSKISKIYKIQESYFPTQRLRCGIPRTDTLYTDCVNYDNNLLKYSQRYAFTK